jgi:hypothetical protein
VCARHLVAVSPLRAIRDENPEIATIRNLAAACVPLANTPRPPNTLRPGSEWKMAYNRPQLLTMPDRVFRVGANEINLSKPWPQKIRGVVLCIMLYSSG